MLGKEALNRVSSPRNGDPREFAPCLTETKVLGGLAKTRDRESNARILPEFYIKLMTQIPSSIFIHEAGNCL
jgi:hypothetical protein